jgi:PKHD-type hydroxylase
MTTQSTYLIINNLLNPLQINQIHNLLDDKVFENGKLTASNAAREVKHNLQMHTQSQEYLSLQQILLMALNSSQLFRQAVFPKHIYPFLVSKYKQGMSYGWHVDSPLMGDLMRSDIAMTIFLNDASEYEGGELELQTPTGNQLYKLNAGDVICYPCTQLHQVREVVKGERKVAVTWVQSLLKSAEQRKILFELQQVIESLRAKDLKSDEANLLQQSHSNLLRMWCD